MFVLVVALAAVLILAISMFVVAGLYSMRYGRRVGNRRDVAGGAEAAEDSGWYEEDLEFDGPLPRVAAVDMVKKLKLSR